MEITLFFGLLFFSFLLAYFYFSKSISYLGVLAGIITILLGITLAANGSIDSTFCFSNKTNQSQTGTVTVYSYDTLCHTESLPIGRDFINAMGLIMVVVGLGVILDFRFNILGSRVKK